MTLCWMMFDRPTCRFIELCGTKATEPQRSNSEKRNRSQLHLKPFYLFFSFEEGKTFSSFSLSLSWKCFAGNERRMECLEFFLFPISLGCRQQTKKESYPTFKTFKIYNERYFHLTFSFAVSSFLGLKFLQLSLNPPSLEMRPLRSRAKRSNNYK